MNLEAEMVCRKLLSASVLAYKKYNDNNCYTLVNYYLQLYNLFKNNSDDENILFQIDCGTNRLDQYHWLIMDKQHEICTFENPVFMNELKFLLQAYQNENLEETYNNYQSKLKELGTNYYFKVMLETDAYLYQDETKKMITENFPIDFLFSLKYLLEADKQSLSHEEYDKLFDTGFHMENVILIPEEKELVTSLLQLGKQK